MDGKECFNMMMGVDVDKWRNETKGNVNVFINTIELC